MWQVAFKDPKMLKHGKTRVRVQSRNRFRFWIWFVGNVAPVFQNQLMRMVAAFASQEPEAKETIGKVRQNQCNLWFLFRIQLSSADDSLDWHRFRVKKRLFRNGHEFFWNSLLNQLFISSLTAVDQFHSYDNIIPNILYVCNFLIWCFCSFPWGNVIGWNGGEIFCRLSWINLDSQLNIALYYRLELHYAVDLDLGRLIDWRWMLSLVLNNISNTSDN